MLQSKPVQQLLPCVCDTQFALYAKCLCEFNSVTVHVESVQPDSQRQHYRQFDEEVIKSCCTQILSLNVL